MKKSNVVFSAVMVFLIVVCIAAAAFSLSPKFRVSLFVMFNGERLERAIESDGGIPIIGGVDAMNFWGDDMAEFVLFKIRDTCYGCYYSRSGEAFAFQGMDSKLSQTAENCWKWQADGYSGETSRILGNWYYFKAIY